MKSKEAQMTMLKKLANMMYGLEVDDWENGKTAKPEPLLAAMSDDEDEPEVMVESDDDSGSSRKDDLRAVMEKFFAPKMPNKEDLPPEGTMMGGMIAKSKPVAKITEMMIAKEEPKPKRSRSKKRA